MPYLSRPPQALGDQVYFNDHIFRFANSAEARTAASELAECNRRGSLWELVDLVARYEIAQLSRRAREWPSETLH